MKVSQLLTLTVIFCATTGAVRAEEAGTDTSRDLTRLNYYPHAEKIYLSPDIQYIPTDLGTPERGDSPLDGSATYLTQFDLTIIYGFLLDGLRLGAAESLVSHRWTDTFDPRTNFTNQTQSSGFSDPTFQLQYRYIDSEPTGLSADAGLLYSPDWISHNIASSMTDGNNGRGYATLNFAANFYWICLHNDLGLAANLIDDLTGTGVNSTNPSNNYSRASVWLFMLTATERFHITSDFYAQASAAFNLPYSFDQTNSAATPVTTNYQYPFHINPALLLGYRFAPKFVLDASYTYQNYTSTAVPIAPPSTTTQTIENTLELRGRFEI